jgi:hypothetical protein
MATTRPSLDTPLEAPDRGSQGASKGAKANAANCPRFPECLGSICLWTNLRTPSPSSTPCRSKTMKLTLKHAIAAIILMLRFATPGGAGPLEDADAAIKRRDYATAVAATFIGLAVVAPERVDRTMMDILSKIVTAVAGN